MRTIYLVRHGKACTQDGIRKCIGTTDVPLDAAAREPAIRLGTWIRERQKNIKGSLTVASSTRIRAKDTAAAIMEGTGSVAENGLYLDAGFDEVHTGLWENRDFADIRDQEREKYEERGKSLGYFRFPGGESIYDAGQRFEKALKKLRKTTKQDILVVSHSGSIRAYLCKLLGISMDDFMKLGSANLSVCILMEDESGLSVKKTAYKPAALLDESEIAWLYQRYKVPEHIVSHMKKTAEMAEHLLMRLGPDQNLDGDLVKKAACVHDIARTRPLHALRGADILRREGYYDIAELVEYHHSTLIDPEKPLNEKDLLFYADKRIQEDRIVSLEERFARSAAKCLTKEAGKKHMALYQKAVLIEQKIQSYVNGGGI